MVHLQFSVYVHHKLLNYKEYYFLGYNTMHSIESQLMFRRNISPPSSVRDSSSGAHTATASLLAATLSADSKSGCLLVDPLGSPPPVLTTPWPAAKQGGPVSLAQASLLQPVLSRHSSGMPCLRVMALLRAPQYLTSYRTLCLPAHLYALLLTAINICYRNLCGHLSEYQNQHPTASL
jgi:hypothetical protein